MYRIEVIRPYRLVKAKKADCLATVPSAPFRFQEAELFTWASRPTHTQRLMSYFPLHFIYQFTALTSFLKLLDSNLSLGL